MTVELTGTYIGRFQPFHNGHLEVIKYLYSVEGIRHLNIVIGSSNKDNQPNNPFTKMERFCMILDTLKSATYEPKDLQHFPGTRGSSKWPIQNWHIEYLPDKDNDILWIQSFKELIPNHGCVYSNNPWVQNLMKNDGINVASLPIMKGASGTQIRELIKNRDDSWKTFVPAATVSVINQVNGVKRIQELNA